ncbi:MAG: hypothetical protein H7Y31_07130 [Chitinophagaceae bacterium]|nr:hypothetical protein [Chitinophagaceae bacterium]
MISVARKYHYHFLLLILSMVTCASTIQAQQKEITSYSTGSRPTERIFIHTAKTYFLPGEIIWFKMYVTETVSNTPSLTSKVGYVEVVDATNKPVIQIKIAIDSGSGSGSIKIPTYLSSNNYYLRAYTNLLKNVSPDHYFHQSITILNVDKLTSPITSANSYSVRFFPEGGNLIEGVSNRVAFKATDASGKSIHVSGNIVNEQNEAIVSFQTTKFGMGRFTFQPQPGKKYKTVVTYPDQSKATVDLPAMESKGFVMQVNDNNANDIQVDIQADAEGQFVYLLLQPSTGTPQHFSGRIQNKQIKFAIPKNKFGTGVTQLTVFNEQFNPTAERLFFTKPATALSITTKTDSNHYPTRSPIKATIQAGIKNSRTDLSMAVYRVDSITSFPAADIYYHSWLQNHIKGSIEDPAYYFTSSDADVKETADNLMLTQGWRKVSGISKNRSTTYIPEIAGHIITGRVIDRRTGSPAGGILTYLTVPGERFHFSTCLSNPDGSIRFDIKKIFGTENIIVQTNKETDSFYRVEIDNPFSEKFAEGGLPMFSLSAQDQQHLLTRLTATQVENAYRNKQQDLFYLPNFSDTTAFFGKPDKVYVLDDYTRFSTMEEVLIEYVTEIQLRKAQGRYRYKMYNLPYRTYFEGNPLVLLDGVPVFDLAKITTFDPLKIKRLDVVSRRYFQGAITYEGIASFSSYQGDLAGYPLDQTALLLEYAGLQLERQFYAPVYDNAKAKSSRIPDFRSLLYWSPDIKPNSNGEDTQTFYSSDLPGRYALVVQGVSSNGTVGSSVSYFTVSKK